MKPRIWLAVLALAACTAPKQPHRLSGFLGDTSKLRVQHERGGVLFYEKKGTRWLDYERLLLEEPVVLLETGADAASVDEDDRRELSVYFGTRLREAVEGAYPLADSPGPDVLRVRAAITNVTPAQGPRHGVGFQIGGAAIEAEFLDSMTGERLAAFADNQQERRFGSLNALSSWNDAKDAFDDWARRFRTWLDKKQGRPTPPELIPADR